MSDFIDVSPHTGQSPFYMNVAIRRLDQDRNMFEFVICTPTLKSTFLLPRQLVNQLRGLVEKALLDK